jgi:glycosyltransferase involved in cell wall biosynthesis/GR25 family glycosyltransferase involved in LPS biosynthesis
MSERNPQFAATYVINLPRSADRWETLQPVLERMRQPNVIRFAATDGATLGLEGMRRLQDLGRLSRDLSQFDSGCGEGEIGCALSHAAILRDIVEQGWPHALILEDDVVLAGDPRTWYRRFQKAFADLPPSWELWYLYRCLDVEHRTRRISRRTAIPWTPLGGAAYAVTLEGARKLLAAMTPTASAVDRVYAETVRERAVNAWAASPRLILPGAHASIINRANPSKRWVEKGVNLPPEYWPPEFLAHLGEQDPHPRRTEWTRQAAGAWNTVRQALARPEPPPAAPILVRKQFPRTVYIVVWWFAASGGLERHITELAESLRRQGTEVIIFSETPVSENNQYVRQLRAGGVRIVAPGWILGLVDEAGKRKLGRWKGRLERLQGILHRLRRRFERTAHDPEWTSADEQIIEDHVHNLLTRSLMRSLSQTARVSPPDAIHLHGCRFGQSWILEWAAAHGYPSVYTEHTTMADWGGPFDAQGATAAGRSADLLCCVSNSARAGMLAALPDPRSIHIARHIIRGPGEWAVRHGRGPESKPVRVLCVARLAHHKGIDVLLEAVGMLRREGVELTLELAGGGDDRWKFEQQAARLEIADCVQFLGEVENNQISNLWIRADFGVLPSRTEGLPLSVVEAMAHGKAVVATRAGGIPEVIRHQENGLLVAPEDAGGLRDALRRLVEDTALRARLGAAARESFLSGGWSEREVVSHAVSLYAQAGEKRAALEDLKEQRRDTIEHARRRHSEWLRERADEALAGLRCVYFVLEQMTTSDAMENRLVDRAEVLARAGVEVVVMSAMPVYWDRRSRARLRRAGVRVLGPSQFELLRRRFIQDAAESKEEKGANIASARVVAVLRRECARRLPDAIHVHGGYHGANGRAPSRTALFADALRIPVVYTVEGVEMPPAGPELGSLRRELENELTAVGFTPVEAAAAIASILEKSSARYRELDRVYRSTDLYRNVLTGEFVEGGSVSAHR